MFYRPLGALLGLTLFVGCHETSTPPATAPAKPSQATTEDIDPLRLYPESKAFTSDVAWHRHYGNTEIRTSWFLNGKVNVAMVCSADLSTYKVTTAREVYDHATQSYKIRELSDAQILTLKHLAKNLPPSAKMPDIKNLIMVSVVEKEKSKIYLYDRLDPPRDIIRLFDLTGAYLVTEPVR